MPQRKHEPLVAAASADVQTSCSNGRTLHPVRKASRLFPRKDICLNTLPTLPLRIEAHALRHVHLACRVLLLGAGIACMSVATAGGTAATDASRRYEKERAVCMNGQSNQTRATCLREAGAAYEEAKRHGLGNGAAPYERNAMQRCENFKNEDRAACEARMMGQGTTSGSAASGGILRELEVTTPGATAAPTTK